MFKKHWQFTIVLTVLVVTATVIILFAPIFPVETTITQTRTRPLQYSAQDYNILMFPRFVDVTNNDSVGGVFSVTLELSEGKGVVGGVEFTTIKQKHYLDLLMLERLKSSAVLMNGFLFSGSTRSFTK
jgi:hypothetical protein